MIKKLSGFTLIEIIIAIAIFSILAMISLPIFTDMIRESRRFDAKSSLMSIEQEQETFRTNNTTYGSISDIWDGDQTPENYYTLTITNSSSTGYTATATANGDQANDDENGVNCDPLQVQVVGLQTTRTPAACW